MTEATPQPHINPDTFKWSQTNAVTAILPHDALARCLAGLATTGVDVTDVAVLEGDKGQSILDVEGTEHGFWAHVLRSLQKLGSASNERENYSDALGQGKIVLSVPTDGDDQTYAVAKAISAVGGERMLHFGNTNDAEEL